MIDLMATAVDPHRRQVSTTFQNNAILPMEGVSLRPALEGKPLDRKLPIFWEHEGNKAVRDGKWKLVQKWKMPWELYDMEADRTELHNVIEQNKEVGDRLIAAWRGMGRTGLCRSLAGPRSHELGRRY